MLTWHPSKTSRTQAVHVPRLTTNSKCTRSASAIDLLNHRNSTRFLSHLQCWIGSCLSAWLSRKVKGGKWVQRQNELEPAKTPGNEHATASRCLRIKHAPKIISCIEKRDTITKLLTWLAESPFPQLKELDPHLVGDFIGSPWIICLIRQPLHCGRGRRRWGYRNQCCWCVPRWRWLWRLGPRRRRRSSFGSLGPRRHGWWLPGHWCWTSWHLSSWRWSHSWLWMVLPQRQASSIND